MIKDFGEKLLKRYMEETNQEKEVFKGVDIIDLVRRDSAVLNMFRKGLVRGLWPQNCLELGK